MFQGLILRWQAVRGAAFFFVAAPPNICFRAMWTQKKRLIFSVVFRRIRGKREIDFAPLHGVSRHSSFPRQAKEVIRHGQNRIASGIFRRFRSTTNRFAVEQKRQKPLFRVAFVRANCFAVEAEGFEPPTLCL